ncbi:probable metal-nicotianamine transporter YSL7 [Salvia miltiorrhiza]|uniref:probable metal-nicotianamine transporter YSL7 n=1 Tax=Salvia miltiorrhiza TaxID=226208 RepID=UPI0025AC2F4E|nr:probable metal-nicotianamine transporter YSL7 [Salvia miltiorrhiza]
MGNASEINVVEDESSIECGKQKSEENLKKGEAKELEDEELSVERMFENKEASSWRKQLSVRAFAVGFLLSLLFSCIVMKLNLTTGIIPSLNISAALLGFFFVKIWTKLMAKFGMLTHPFTRQENTVIQTCVTASSGIAFSGGFGSYLLAMSERVAKQSEDSRDGLDYKNISLGWMIIFLAAVSFLGLFCVAPLSKVMIINFKLTYPSATATANLINSFHTPQGVKLAKKQVRELGKFFSYTFLWGFFQWFFQTEDDCGFSSFPTFGLKALENRFYFDFSTTYVGVGMICPRIINVSLLVGGIISWGIMWPLIETRKGSWYSADLPSSSLQGLQGYKVFIGIAMILGDGIYFSFKLLFLAVARYAAKLREKNANMQIPVSQHSSPSTTFKSYDERCRTQFFLKYQVPTWFAIGGYIIIASITTAALPHILHQLKWYFLFGTLTRIFHQLKWYYITVLYIFGPSLAFCNAFGCGLTDWSLASAYGKLAIFAIGAWAGASHGGILVSLAACGVMMNIVTTASDLMQDFKTGYLTMSSPRSMFVSQAIGTAMGCVISPCVFWIFYKAIPDLGLPTSNYPAPYATIYYNIAKLGVEGPSALPYYCMKLCYVFFAAAILINLIRDVLGKKRSWFIPLPTAMAIPFYLGAYFTIDMCVGSLLLYIWQKINKAKADAFGPAVASGLICGEAMWAFPSSVLALAGVKPPICMKFLSRKTNSKVDNFLRS